MDVASARADRHALFTLVNDYRALTEELHRSLEALHALRREQSSRAEASAHLVDPPRAAPAPAASQAAPLANGAPAAKAFAVVDSVAPGSPASRAGVRVRPWVGQLDLVARLFVSTGGASTCASARRPATKSCSLAEWLLREAVSCARWPLPYRRVPRPGCAVLSVCIRFTAVSVQASEDQAMALTVRREGRSAHLSVTPQRWSGPGLLGMHLRPLANA